MNSVEGQFSNFSTRI